MDIDDLLGPDGIVLRSGASSKREAFRVIASAAAQSLSLDEGRVLDALLEREALGSTGLGNGVAIPHARVEGVTRICGVFLRLDTPVAYGAVDDRPVDLMFALFAPPRDGAGHLRALAAVSRALRSAVLREELRQAHTVDALHALFVRNEAANAA